MFDLVVIIRGGGSQTDLSWFDSYNIAYHVTQFPLPVVTGIGHDKDISVTDMVAHTSLKTPTAVADFLVDSVARAENHILEISSEIIKTSQAIIEKNRTRIESSNNKYREGKNYQSRFDPCKSGIQAHISSKISFFGSRINAYAEY